MCAPGQRRLDMRCQLASRLRLSRPFARRSRHACCDETVAAAFSRGQHCPRPQQQYRRRRRSSSTQEKLEEPVELEALGVGT